MFRPLLSWPSSGWKQNYLRKRHITICAIFIKLGWRGCYQENYFYQSENENQFEIIQQFSLLTFLYGSENWTLTASHRRRIEAAEMKLLRPLAGHTFNDQKQMTPYAATCKTECILNRIDEYRRNWLLHLQRMPQNRIPSKSYRYSPQGNRTSWETQEALEKQL
jgi:hypothetical protein